MKTSTIGIISGVALATSGIVLGSSPSASAVVLWDWGYGGQNVAGGNGSFTTTDEFTDGSYLITEIVGDAEGSPITSLIEPGGFASNDNQLFATFPQLQIGGFAFNTNFGPVNIKSDGSNGYTFQQGGLLTSVAFNATRRDIPTQPVPEPSSLLGYITLGSLMLGSAVRKARK